MTTSDQTPNTSEALPKDIVSLTITIGWKNKKRPSGPTDLDLEAGNLVAIKIKFCTFFQYLFTTKFVYYLYFILYCAVTYFAKVLNQKKIGELKQDAFFSINRIGYRNLLLKLLKI